jgi:DNA helicase-2/ATP-dependent DNA helicase PcrA
VCAFPSEEQAAVINYSGRALVVVAGPGTGKTRTIVERMSRLLIHNPRRIISFITFTRTSRRDTDAKLRQVVDEKAVEIPEGGLPRISTLHAFAKGLVHRYAGRLGRDPDFTVMVTKQGERRILISEIIDDLGLSVDAGALEEAVARFRSTGAWPATLELTASQRLNVIEAFESLLRFYNTFDIEGLVVAASEILSRGVSDLPDVFLQVDEYQDLNPNDQQLVRHASGTGASQVVVVGDDAQSIYGFRHVHPAGIRELWESPDWDTMRFRECHRLPPHVLLAAHSLTQSRNYLGGEVDLPPDDGRRLLTLQCTTEDVQLRALPLHIHHLMTTFPNQSGNQQALRDFMVLCPSNNHADRAAAALESHGLPMRRKRGGIIVEEIWRLILVLRLLNNADGLALRQCLEFTPLPKARIRQIRREAARAQKSLYEYCARLEDDEIQSVVAARDRLWNSMIDPAQFRQQLLDFPYMRLEGLASNAIDEILDCLPVVGRMVGHIYERHGVVDLDGETDDVPDEDKVLVATMHSAKGLEANVVYILWLDDRFMPAGGRDPVEEERVLYVALTRAKQDVVLMSTGRHDKATGRYLTSQWTMSPFLHSIEGYLDIRRVRAADLKAANPF